MKRRTKSLLGVSCAVILALTLRYCVRSSEQVRLVPSDDDGGSRSATTPLSHARARAADPLAAMASAFKTPIELYGRVEDQHGDAVAGATVTLSPVDTPFGDESKSTTTLASDGKGLFSIKGLRGYSMGINVRKEGYLHISPVGKDPTSSAMLLYAGGAEEGKRHSKAETPLVLRLHRIGPTEPLVYVASQRWRLPVNGTPRIIALDNKTGTGRHQIEFRFKTEWINIPADNEHFGKQFDWSLEAKITGGGFIWNNSDFNSEAPQDGYKEKITVKFPQALLSNEWRRETYGSFFVRFPDGNYGRIKVNINGMTRDGESALRLESWLNLRSGSRNLSTPHVMQSSATQERYQKGWE
jgi:hypothetical protein